MFRQVTMILLVFAVLLGSGHAASWSHNDADGAHHALVAHANDHDGDRGQMVEQENPSETTGMKGDVVSQHSHPVGVAVDPIPFGIGGAASTTLNVILPARMLASFSQAPPTEPPAA
ncbi:MAG: hypothetical protein C0429_16020 [Sphingopyxis sp.]|nr:hypothetical protein [Sphingopyxis sp.]